jgi:hypothetical protein
MKHAVKQPAIGIAIRLDNHVAVQREAIVLSLSGPCSRIFPLPARRLHPRGRHVLDLAHVAGERDESRFA